MKQTSVLDIKGFDERSPYAVDDTAPMVAAEEEVAYVTIPQMEKAISQIKKANGKSRQRP